MLTVGVIFNTLLMGEQRRSPCHDGDSRRWIFQHVEVLQEAISFEPTTGAGAAALFMDHCQSYTQQMAYWQAVWQTITATYG